MDILLCGLAITGRTETLEDYLKDKAGSLTVIVISSRFLQENLSSCRIYNKGILQKEFKIPNFRIKDNKSYRQPLVLLFFIVNWIVMSWVIFKAKKKFDLCIGISQSFASWGAVLKKVGIIKYLIYYCGDYYIPESTINFNNLFIKIISLADRFITKNADYVWDVSPHFSEYREKIGRVAKGSYSDYVVPLGYSRSLRRFNQLEEGNRCDIGFVGTITANQGLQLLVEAMPTLIKKLPSVRIKIIGHGPFSQGLKKMVSAHGLDSYFTFFGFIKEEDRMLDIISRCAIGVALWDDSVNIICTDTGKPKLYAFCGLPIIVTKACTTYNEIQAAKAGIAINYNVDELEKAVLYLLTDEVRLKEFKRNSFNLGSSYMSDTIFDRIFQELSFNTR
ncbi:MAG: glycosyltransferase [Candidatus Omnitrophota bacterium]